jgi:hypothetical protein
MESTPRLKQPGFQPSLHWSAEAKCWLGKPKKGETYAYGSGTFGFTWSDSILDIKS